jgi:hypothetical protein
MDAAMSSGEPGFWDGYWHYLIHGNEHPVGFWDHFFNVGGYIAQGTAITAGVAIAALVAPPAVGAFIVGGAVGGGLLSALRYFTHFGEMSVNDHERFWGTMVGGLIVGGVVAVTPRPSIPPPMPPELPPSAKPTTAEIIAIIRQQRVPKAPTQPSPEQPSGDIWSRNRDDDFRIPWNLDNR